MGSSARNQGISDKEYREIYVTMSKERLIEILIENKKEIRRLNGKIEINEKYG